MSAESAYAVPLEGPLVVVGGGTMGAGIALLAAVRGVSVSIVESDRAAVTAARERLDRMLERRVMRGQLAAAQAAATRALVSVGVGYDAVRDLGAVAVIEAVPESLALKQMVLSQAAASLPAAALLSNTSSLAIGELAAGLPAPERRRLVGLHFFNPPTDMELVEVVAPPTAAQPAVAMAHRVAAALGRTAIDVADAPGFVVNRCARPYYLEALRILEQGAGTVVSVDSACQAAGFPLGPFALMDLIGIDIGLDVTRTIWQRCNNASRLRPSGTQELMVAEGRLGRKVGHGFYRYQDGRPVGAPERLPRGSDRAQAAADAAAQAASAIDALLAGREAQPAAAILARILVTLINEAHIMVGEGVASAAAIDLGMTLGLNHPVGPSSWEQWLGSERACGYLNMLESNV